jgi:uncharacterized protein YceK
MKTLFVILVVALVTGCASIDYSLLGLLARAAAGK